LRLASLYRWQFRGEASTGFENIFATPRIPRIAKDAGSGRRDDAFRRKTSPFLALTRFLPGDGKSNAFRSSLNAGTIAPPPYLIRSFRASLTAIPQNLAHEPIGNFIFLTQRPQHGRAATEAILGHG
jgi:hypothetical protein